MSREFEVTREIDLPAAPDDVWTAITADPAAWMFPTGMEIPAGAAPAEGAPVTTWEPPHRLVIRMQSPDGTFNALDYAIEARDGGTAHLRYVHNGILADGWEDQYDIDYLTGEFIGIRDDDGLWRFFGRNAFGSVVGMSAHVFRDDVDPALAEAALKAWLDSVYAPVRQS